MRTETASTEFEALYRAHYPALMRLGYLLTGSDAVIVWADGYLIGWGGSSSAGAVPSPLMSDGVRYRPPS